MRTQVGCRTQKRLADLSLRSGFFRLFSAREIRMPKLFMPPVSVEDKNQRSESCALCSLGVGHSRRGAKLFRTNQTPQKRGREKRMKNIKYKVVKVGSADIVNRTHTLSLSLFFFVFLFMSGCKNGRLKRRSLSLVLLTYLRHHFCVRYFTLSRLNNRRELYSLPLW